MHRSALRIERPREAVSAPRLAFLVLGALSAGQVLHETVGIGGDGSDVFFDTIVHDALAAAASLACVARAVARPTERLAWVCFGCGLAVPCRPVALSRIDTDPYV